MVSQGWETNQTDFNIFNNTRREFVFHELFYPFSPLTTPVNCSDWKSGAGASCPMTKRFYSSLSLCKTMPPNLLPSGGGSNFCGSRPSLVCEWGNERPKTKCSRGSWRCWNHLPPVSLGLQKKILLVTQRSWMVFRHFCLFFVPSWCGFGSPIHRPVATNHSFAGVEWFNTIPAGI